MDPQIAELLAGRPRVSLADLPALRAGLDTAWRTAEPVDPGDVAITDVTLGTGLRIRLLTPPGPGPLPVVISLHGGAMVLGHPEYHDPFNLTLCRGTGAAVVAPDYRLAPEAPFPAALDDCYATLEWVAGQTAGAFDTSRVAVVGDSAGGTLAAATALLARDRQGPALVLQALVEPVLDDRLSTETMNSDGPHWPTTSREMFEQLWNHYLAGQPATEYAAPARAENLRGLPPAYLCLPELDALRDEAIAFARRLMAAGVPTELHLWPGAVHGFLEMPCDLGRKALAELVDRLSAAFAGHPGHSDVTAAPTAAAGSGSRPG